MNCPSLNVLFAIRKTCEQYSFAAVKSRVLSCGCWLRQVELCNCCETVVSCLIVKWEELNVALAFHVSFFAPHLMKVVYTLLKIIFVLRLQKFVIKSIFCCRTIA